MNMTRVALLVLFVAGAASAQTAPKAQVQSNFYESPVPGEVVAPQPSAVPAGQGDPRVAAEAVGAAQRDIDAEAKPAPKPVEGGDDDFQEAIGQVLPMKPDEVLRLRKAAANVEKAEKTPLATPDPLVRSVTLSLQPGAKPETIFVTDGYDSSLTLMDATGAPWPIEKHSIGSDKRFPTANPTPNTLSIKAAERYSGTNLTLHLKGLQTPVVFTVVYSDSKVDYQLTAIVPQPGPTAVIRPAFTSPAESLGVPPLAGRDLTSFLDNLPPSEAASLITSGDDQTAVWWYRGRLIVRTPHILAFPALPPQSVLRGPSTYSVYVLDKPISVITVLRDGMPVNVRVALEQHMLSANDKAGP